MFAICSLILVHNPLYGSGGSASIQCNKHCFPNSLWQAWCYRVWIHYARNVEKYFDRHKFVVEIFELFNLASARHTHTQLPTEKLYVCFVRTFPLLQRHFVVVPDISLHVVDWTKNENWITRNQMSTQKLPPNYLSELQMPFKRREHQTALKTVK